MESLYDFEHLYIRHATHSDALALSAIEAQCFPQEEAAGELQITERLFYFSKHFWLLCSKETGSIVSFVDGMVTDCSDLTDILYEKASLHNENGAWQMIFGVNTVPAFRKKGYASRLLRFVIEESRAQNRKGLVLTCKEHLLPFYANVGFVNEGLSSSCHGGAVWYQMRLTF